ncbi:hypothetical protein BC832DRAFT_611920 [Gaertneriomyces semiglobifer]|nr:hypothetical protein BC832DRAFT_611920 [Gaertneriomyces semiglobifer]
MDGKMYLANAMQPITITHEDSNLRSPTIDLQTSSRKEPGRVHATIVRPSEGTIRHARWAHYEVIALPARARHHASQHWLSGRWEVYLSPEDADIAMLKTLAHFAFREGLFAKALADPYEVKDAVVLPRNHRAKQCPFYDFCASQDRQPEDVHMRAL